MYGIRYGECAARTRFFVSHATYGIRVDKSQLRNFTSVKIFGRFDSVDVVE